MTAPLNLWSADPLPPAVRAALERARRAPDVVAVAAMPDVHLADDVCVGTVIATSRLLYPQAVGGDLGCGVAALRLGATAEALTPARAAALLTGLERLAPVLHQPDPPPLPEALTGGLSASSLNRLAAREGRLELGTVGRGNHFVELGADEAGELWAMAHSGSRCLGPAIQAHHQRRLEPGEAGLLWLEADSPAGQAWLADLAWARKYAAQNRQYLLSAAGALAERLLGAQPDWAGLIDCDHDHVRRERHLDQDLWVHRKGAIFAGEGEPAVIPGSMGSPSYLVEGRGHEAALCSSSHGAGRAMSRTEARGRLSTSALRQQVGRLYFDERKASRLVEEAPAAYKDIRGVMRAQRALTRVRATLSPLLNHKGV